MEIIRRLLLLFLLFASISYVYAQSAQQTKRPKIGLVLSGGGAKGLAHIGVLKVLEEAGIPVDYITGTSMGSVIGGLYACGYKAAEIEKITRDINWDELMLDRISRRNISIEEKEEFDKYVGEFPLVKGKVQIPKGMVDGQKISILLSHYTYPVHNISDFDKLPIPFRCVATDIVNVQPVIFKEGFLPDAIRASLAIPTFFNPIEIDGKLLVDGGIVQNFPVKEAREMGADIIIGVEVSAALYTREQLTTAIRILDQASTYQIVQKCEKQRELCDILIRPDISKYDLFSFHAGDSLLVLGEKAARELMPKLLELSESLKKYNDYIPPSVSSIKRLDTIRISQIKIEGLSKVSKSLVLGNLQLPDSGLISYKELEHGIERVYGTRFFERVNYKIDPNENGSLLTVRLKEQPYNYFRFSINYDEYLKTAVLLNSTHRNILGEGSRLTFDLRLGQYPAFTTKYTIHTSLQPNIGLGLKAGFNSFEAKFYTPKQKLVANFDILHYVAELDFLSTLSNAFLFRTGIQGEFFDISHALDAYDTINNNVRALNWYARLRFDTNDKTIFPSKGDFFNAEIKSVLAAHYETNQNFSPLWKIIAYYNKHIPISKRLVIIPGACGGYTLSPNTHSVFLNYLGGSHPSELNIFPFQGLKFMAIPTHNLTVASLWLRMELWKDKFLTLKTNVARTTDFFEQFFEKGTNYWGIGLSAGIRTILGPLELNVSKSNLYHKPVVEIKVGYTF